ncbi:acyltransferase-like protein at1g54570 chloroplastic [Phtheirospermum japonicum]|uniref:Acyltransferase-like protein at1g54570 chloroplastic n=1 Tax=Phtheirospermum japonicum TaxID=374723 RepID=A0A830BME4_9LAMI|nr:acyltransferase-like protein at1g54570 chloroplastic [Phtheirospermum japonicum]
MIKSDGGPPRWFCPIESGPPLKNSPVLLYLPGIDGLGLGLILHHKALGKVFEIRCMHIPVYDRTPYEKLVNFVENAVRAQHALFPNKPIYLLGDSFGGCLALSVAASNPTVDLVLILVNPATSFHKSKLQPLLPFLKAFPENLNTVLPYIIGATLGDPIKMANVINAKTPLTSPVKQIEKLIHELSSLIIGVPNFSDILPKQTLIWKLKLLESASSSSNSRLVPIEHETLILASGKDNILPSKNEAQRLSELLKNSKIRFFKDNGHALLLEDEINLLTVLKATCMYRRSKRRDPVADFLPPSESEFQKAFDQLLVLFRLAISPVMFSTLNDGKIFLREKNVMVRGMAHPEIFTKNVEKPLQEISGFDYFRVFGATPATSTNFFKLLKNKSHVLLYPGGVREALHRKGEEYKLFWPDEPEFVRMAARFGAKIVPFGVVGEDDLVKLFLDYDDLMRIPLAKEMIKQRNENMARVRVGSEMKGEVAKQDFFVPGFYPKVPGRFYFLFGKVMETEGREELVKDKLEANEFYSRIKCEVEQCMAYLIKKREEDPYRHLVDRLLYRAVSAPVHHVPTFDP